MGRGVWSRMGGGREAMTEVVAGLALIWSVVWWPPVVGQEKGLGPIRIEQVGIENLYRVSPRVYSGGEPEGEEAFRALAGLGVKTIITVDGGVPDVETARRFGLRYVHVPVGYDGIDEKEARTIVRAAATLPGPVYVHCHHGKHRGPTAASLCLIALEGWSVEAATAWMKEAGTAADYAGLYGTIERYRAPDLGELAREEGPLPERVEPPGLVERMIEVDKTFDRLKAIQASGFKAPPNQPDLDPAHEALMLAEHYREAARLEESRERGDGLVEALARAEGNAVGLREELKRLTTASEDSRGSVLPRLQAAYQVVASDCKGCHARHRDGGGTGNR